MTEERKKEMDKSLNEFFSNPKYSKMIYQGYVDDPRNTDHSWMETVAVNFHDENGDCVSQFKLHAGDDACGVQWMTVSKQMKLFASHADFLQTVAELRNATW